MRCHCGRQFSGAGLRERRGLQYLCSGEQSNGEGRKGAGRDGTGRDFRVPFTNVSSLMSCNFSLPHARKHDKSCTEHYSTATKLIHLLYGE